MSAPGETPGKVTLPVDTDSLFPDDALPESVLARLQAMSDTLAGVAGRLKAVALTSARTRHLAIGLAVSVGIDILLTIVVTLLTISALHQNTALHSSQLAACAIGDKTRANERALWAHLLAISAHKDPAFDAQFTTYVDKTFANIDCAQLYK